MGWALRRCQLLFWPSSGPVGGTSLSQHLVSHTMILLIPHPVWVYVRRVSCPISSLQLFQSRGLGLHSCYPDFYPDLTLDPGKSLTDIRPEPLALLQSYPGRMEERGPRRGELTVLCSLSGNVEVQTGPRGLPRGAYSNLRAMFVSQVRKNIPIQGGSPPKLKTKGTNFRKLIDRVLILKILNQE